MDREMCSGVNHEESSSQYLLSLNLLETLSIDVEYDIPNLWNALHGLNIKSLSLTLSNRAGRVRVNNEESSSQNLVSLNQLETLTINVYYGIPNIWNALHGLNITSLSLNVRNGWTHIESISQALVSFTKMETLSLSPDIYVRWEVLRGLNIKSLSLDFWHLPKHILHKKKTVEFVSQVLSSLSRLETLSISVDEDSPGLWEALFGLNIKSLSLSGGRSGFLIVNHVESLSQCLASLKVKLEKVSICDLEERLGLWEALCGLNIKTLNLSGFYKVYNVELLSNSLSSLTQLKTLSIIVQKDTPGLWEALSSLNIKSLIVSDKVNGLRVKH
ncbi:hypothetical protein DPMN_169277 [Dreissena polymorpha]|uniref:Uncharacterized protein n=1 Tax=Dreissena polymorpha TaxID=45954 RepID=A0A9D4F6Q3_DREPO|nr:hypothetical protein DPMN_169277 [Dreissena polymorpha]